MPVHEIKYTAWQGDLKPVWQRLLAVPKYTLMSVFNKWLATTVFGIGLMQLLGYTGIIILITNPLVREALNMRMEALPQLQPDDIMRRFYLVQMVVCVLAILLAAPKMISTELAHRALPMLYSRPIKRSGYILGKLVGLMALLSFMTWFQAIILFIIMAVNYPADVLFQTHFASYSLPLLMRAMVVGVLISFALAIVALACSSATKNARYAGVLFLVLTFAASFVSHIIQSSFLPRFPDLGLREILVLMADGYLTASHSVGGETGAVWGRGSGISWANVWIGLLAWCGLSFAFMCWKLRPVDIYKE